MDVRGWARCLGYVSAIPLRSLTKSADVAIRWSRRFEVGDREGSQEGKVLMALRLGLIEVPMNQMESSIS